METSLLTYIPLLFVATATLATRPQVGALTVSEYAALVEAFEETLSAKTVEGLAEFSPETIRTASENYRRSLLVNSQDRGERRLAHKLKLAALFHTEASMHVSSEADVFLHMDIAKGYIERLEEERERRSTLKRWCLALGYFFQFQVMEPLATLPFETALQLDPDNVEILLALGRVSETAGWMKKSSEQLARAEKWYRRILEIEPRHEAAKVGLAHVLMLKESYGEALRLVEPLAGNSAENYLDVVSLLILGDIYKSQDQLPKAIRTYRNAVQIDPNCQAAVVGLAHAQYLNEDIEAARDVMKEFFANPATNETDSWWIYLKGDRRRYVGLLEEMRKEISK